MGGQEREAFFEEMITGGGINAIKFPRRGKQRKVLLTLRFVGGAGAGARAGGGQGRDNNHARDVGSSFAAQQSFRLASPQAFAGSKSTMFGKGELLFFFVILEDKMIGGKREEKEERVF